MVVPDAIFFKFFMLFPNESKTQAENNILRCLIIGKMTNKHLMQLEIMKREMKNAAGSFSHNTLMVVSPAKPIG